VGASTFVVCALYFLVTPWLRLHSNADVYEPSSLTPVDNPSGLQFVCIVIQTQLKGHLLNDEV